MNRLGDNFKTEKTKIFIYSLNSAFLDLTAMGSCRGRWHQHIQKESEIFIDNRAMMNANRIMLERIFSQP